MWLGVWLVFPVALECPFSWAQWVGLKGRILEVSIFWTWCISLDTGLGQAWAVPALELLSRKSGESWHFTDFSWSLGGRFCLWFSCTFPCEYYQRKYIFSLIGHTSFHVHYAFGNSSLHLNASSSLDLVIWAVLSLWVHCCGRSQALGFTGWDAAPSHWRSLSCGICLLCNVKWTQVHWLWRLGKKIPSLWGVIGSWSLFAFWLRALYLILLKYCSKFSYAGHVLYLSETLLHRVTSSCTFSGFTKPKITASF